MVDKVIKVLYITNIPSPYRVSFFEEFSKYVDLTVLYELKKAKTRDEKWISDQKKLCKSVLMPGIQIRGDAALCPAVLHYIKDPSYDYIIVGGYSTPTGMLAILFMRMMRKKYILNIDGGMIKKENRLSYWVKRFFIGSASAWLSTSKGSDDYLCHYGAKKPYIYRYPFSSIRKEDIVGISENGKVRLREKLGVKESFIILSVGRFIKSKRFETLLYAKGSLPGDVGLYIIGGEETKEYKEIVKANNLCNVHFMNFMGKDELSQYYSMADIFVLPTANDVWGLVVNEAFAHGLPVITTDKCVAGIELVKNGENGFIVPVDDVNSLVEKVMFYYNNEVDIQQQYRMIYETIQDYSIEGMAIAHLHILEKLTCDIEAKGDR